MEKQILFKHGVSVNGELQVYKITQYMEGNEVKHETTDNPYSPSDVQKMGDFDIKSQRIVEALYVPEVIEEVQADIAYYLEKLNKPGFREVVRYDRMIDELSRIPIRQVSELVENGKIISKKYHRSWIMPGSAFLDQDVLSRKLAEKFHIPATVEAFHEAMAANDEAFHAGLNGEAIIV